MFLQPVFKLDFSQVNAENTKAAIEHAPASRLNVWLRPAFAADFAPKTFVRFATSLIATKPIKPCDGGVFGGLNSLSKKE